jgi:hypothetical protein
LAEHRIRNPKILYTTPCLIAPVGRFLLVENARVFGIVKN